MYKKAFELSYKNKKVEIEIQDFVGDVRNINGTEDLFSLSYISDSKDKGQSILVTEADINFYADDYFNIDELKTVGETDIKVKYYENDALLWSGFVIPDFFSTSVDIAPVVSMVATDRVGTLKEISNNAESNIPIQILASCLKQTGQDLPINLIADNNHFETPIQLDRIEEIASYDVIRTFMVLFNCKITLYKNAWWIINKKLLESGFVNYKSYNSDGAGGSVTPFAQPILDIDLVDRDGQREIKPTASEVSLFLEFGGSKKYPKNWDFEKWNGSSFNDWTAKNDFIPKLNTKQITGYTFANNYYKAIFGADIKRKSLHIKQTGGTGTIGNYYTRSHYQSSFEKIPFNEDGATITVQANITTPSGKGLRVVPFIKIPNRNPSQNEYYAISKDGSVSKVGTGSSIDLSKIKPISINNSVDDSAPTDAIEFSWSEDFKIIPSQLNVGRSLNAEASILIFEGRIDSLNENDADIFIHSIQLIFNKNEQAGKGLIFKVKQGGEKFSKSREPETILFSDKINQGVNGYFYNYKYDDTSIVDLPSEFALSSVRERADMFSKARDYYSLDGDFIVNPLAKYKCGLKSFVLVGGENRREDAGIIVEEIVSNTLNRTDFIYTYFDDGKDKVKSIGTASGGSSSSGGGGAVSSPQLWKVDEEGNIYTEYNAYSLKNLSAFGFEEEQGGGDGGGSMDRLDTWASYDASKSGWVLSAFLGNDLNTRVTAIDGRVTAIDGRVTAIDGRVTDLENSSGGGGSGSVTSVGISVPTGLSVSNSPITSSGVIAIGLQTGYSIPTTDKQGQWDAALTNNHTHDNKGVIDKLTQANIDVLEKLSLVDGNLRIDATAYSTGNLSAFGLGEDGGGSGGGSMSMMQGWAFTTETENYYLPAKLAVPFYNDTRSRLSTLEAGTAPASHTHPISDITNLQTTLNNKLETSVFNTHNTDNIRHITGAERTKWDTVVTDFAGLGIGGRNLFSNSTTVISQTGLLAYSKRDDINGFYSAGQNNNYTNYVRLNNVIKGNGHYTVSFEMRGIQSTGAGLYVSIAGVRSGSAFLTNNLNTYNGRKYYTVEVTNYSEENSHVDFHLGYVYFYIKDIQVEKGNKATDWTPAPEDQVSDWLTTDVNSFSFIKNKPTKLSDFINDNFVDLTTNQTIGGMKTFKDVLRVLNPNSSGISAKILCYPSSPYGLIFSTNSSGTQSIQSQRESDDSQKFNIALNPNGGNVGIGTTNPQYKLDVSGTGRFTDKIISGTGKGFRNAGFQTGFNPIWAFNNSETYGLGYYQGAHGLVGVTGDAIGFHFGSTTAPKVIIDSAGNVTASTFVGALSVNTPKVTFGNGWTAEGVGAELQFKLNGVIQAKIVNGALVSMGEVTAFY